MIPYIQLFTWISLCQLRCGGRMIVCCPCCASWMLFSGYILCSYSEASEILWHENRLSPAPPGSRGSVFIGVSSVVIKILIFRELISLLNLSILQTACFDSPFLWIWYYWNLKNCWGVREKNICEKYFLVLI